MNTSTPTTARSFFDVSEATTTVLDLLATQLPDCAVFVAYHDAEARILPGKMTQRSPKFPTHPAPTALTVQRRGWVRCSRGASWLRARPDATSDRHRG